MAEAFINSICKLIMIAGEQTPAPYVGVSAQIDVMQDWMADDMLPAMTGEEDLTQAPEVWEAQNLNYTDAINDYEGHIRFISDTPGDRGFDIFDHHEVQQQLFNFLSQLLGEEIANQGYLSELITRIHSNDQGTAGRGIDDDPNEIYDRERLQQLIEQIRTENCDDQVTSRIFGVDDAIIIAVISVAGPILWDVAKNPKVQNFARKSLDYIPQMAGSAWRFLKGGEKIKKSTDFLRVYP